LRLTSEGRDHRQFLAAVTRSVQSGIASVIGTVVAFTVWEILEQAGIDPAPERTTAT
jgi:hypothetical protein